MPHWGIFPSFSHGGDRSLTYPLQFPSLGRDILYSPHWPLFLSSSSIWALSGALFETRRVPFSHFQRIEICSGMPYWGIPHLWVHRMFCRSFSLLSLFLDLYGSSHWGIFPILIEICRFPTDLHDNPQLWDTRQVDDSIPFYPDTPRSLFWVFQPDLTLWYSRGSWTELYRVSGSPRHHLSGVHIRSFTHPHGVILGLSGRIGYIWCHTRAYFPPLAMETIVLSQTRYSFCHSAKRYCVHLIDHYSWALHLDKLSVERWSRLVESLSAISNGFRFAATCHTGAYFPLIVSSRSGVQGRRSFTVYDIQSYHVTLSVRHSEPLL